MPKTILIVDDMNINRQILCQMLRSDYSILEASSGEEALDILGREGQSISAVLLDISMPGLDGYEVLLRIRKDAVLAQLPVIMITGSEDEESRTKSLSLGANDYVIKPYNLEIVKHCLRNNIALREATAMVTTLEKDKLTGLWTREAFFRRAAEEIEKQPAGYYVISCIDIERFKVINDQYGNDTGDKILATIGEILQSGCDDLDGICGHIFADQFVTLLPRKLLQTGSISLSDLETKISAASDIKLTLSIGDYIVADKTLGVNVMFDRAAIAENSIKGRFDTHEATYDDSMHDRIVHEQEIVNDMNAALAERQFEVWFQPQYNHASGAMIGAEALVRWRHPKKGLIPPIDFIPIFEKNGFIYTLDKFVWEETCRNLRTWINEGRSPLPISVNVSRYDILQSDFIETLKSLVAQYDLPLDLLRIEITESAFAESSQHIIDVASSLVSYGFTVEIDDFGSGYSSLNTLKDVPAQIIKLDMRFLESSTDSQRGGNIVESVVRMTKWLGLSVIAEGVETIEQADYLHSIGCNYIQGYLYAKPMPIDDYENHCRKGEKEEHLLTLETVDNLDNNSFWDPKSIDTLIFNSYVGAACIFEYHHKTIEVIRATDKYAEMISGGSMSATDVLRLDWSTYLDDENKQMVDNAIQSSRKSSTDTTLEFVLSGLPGCSEKTHIRATLRVIAVVGSRLLVYSLGENITQRCEAEQKNIEVATQIENMISDMPGGFSRLRLYPDGKLEPIYFNDGLVALTGMNRDELNKMHGGSVFAGVRPESVPVVKNTVAKMVETGMPHSFSFRLERPKGKPIWLSITARITKDASGNTFISIYYMDVSEQVEESEAQKTLLDNLPCGAGVYEFKDGQISLRYQNKNFWELIGLDKEKFSDQAPLSAVHPEDVPIVMQELSAAIEEGRDMSCIIRLRHPIKEYFPVRFVGRVVHMDNGSYHIFAAFAPKDQ